MNKELFYACVEVLVFANPEDYNCPVKDLFDTPQGKEICSQAEPIAKEVSKIINIEKQKSPFAKLQVVRLVDKLKELDYIYKG